MDEGVLLPVGSEGKVARVELWACGHPRTPENSQSIGSAGIRCRTCRRAICRRAAQLRRLNERRPQTRERPVVLPPTREQSVESIVLRAVDRDPCPRCGVRRDHGCAHSNAPISGWL